MGTRHFKNADLKACHEARVESDFSLFSSLDSALHQADIWLCGGRFHTFSKNCKHDDDVVISAPSFDEVAIYGIPEPSRSDLLVVDGRSVSIVELGVSSGASSSSFSASIVLLQEVLAGKCRTVKSIPKENKLGFSRCLKATFDKVVASPQDLA